MALINSKRAAARLPALRNSAGLGCMALQYISDCTAAATCSSQNTVACEPPEAHITEVYAANCGVELPTVGVISGRLIGCNAAPEAVLKMANKSKSVGEAMVLGKEHTQVGAGFDRPHRHGPFFWSLLFSSGSANSTFLLEAGGKGIQQRHGCFSSPERTACNAAPVPPRPCLLLLLLLFLLHLSFSSLSLL